MDDDAEVDRYKGFYDDRRTAIKYLFFVVFGAPNEEARGIKERWLVIVPNFAVDLIAMGFQISSGAQSVTEH